MIIVSFVILIMMTIMIILQVEASVRVMYEWWHSCLTAAPKHYNGWNGLYCFILFFLCYQLLNSVNSLKCLKDA